MTAAETLSLTQFLAHADAEGFSDGLPVVPPTRTLVDEMLAAVPRGTPESLGPMPPLLGELTLELLAANAVMAGCLPEYFPVLIAGMEAILAPEFNAASAGPTTNPVGAMLLVSGPAAAQVGINGSTGCLGPGTRANATIGRASRLAWINVGGAKPGLIDQATQGFPGKFTMCFTENVEESPWQPYHVRHGFAETDSVVTAYQACGTLNIQDQPSSKASELIRTVSGAMRVLGSNNLLTGRGPVFVALCPKHAKILAQEYSLADIQQILFDTTAMRVDAMPDAYRGYVVRRRELPDAVEVPITRAPEDIEIVVAGGPGNHSGFIPGYGNGDAPSKPVRPVT